MRKILSLALVALAACGGDKQKPITYGAPEAPTATEISAIQGAQTTLQGSVTFVAPTDPATGGPGLADQLVASLPVATAPEGGPAKLVPATMQEIFPTSGMDPACVTSEPTGAGTTVRWGVTKPCRIDISDPTTTMTVIVTGWLSWTPGTAAGTGTTAWKIHEDFSLQTTSGGQPMSASGGADLYGSLVVAAATITVDGHSESDVTMMGIDEKVNTSLTGTVDYVTSPAFCIVGGGLKLEQRASALGQEQGQGWDFGWTGCGAFTVAHGST